MISLVMLKQNSPIDLTRVISHAHNFNACVNVKISFQNINKAKKSLIEARGHLDLMITALHQVLYDREILKTRTDEVLYLWLIDNLGRFLRNIDEKEESLLVFHDNPNEGKSLVGISRLSVYAKMLKIAGQSLVFESLYKSVEEYNNLEESKRDKQKFIYILFSVLQITLSALGGIARQKTSGQSKRGMVSESPTSWQSLMTTEGQKKIADEHKDNTGEIIHVPDIFLDKNQGEQIIHDEEHLEEEADEESN